MYGKDKKSSDSEFYFVVLNFGVWDFGVTVISCNKVSLNIVYTNNIYNTEERVDFIKPVFE